MNLVGRAAPKRIRGRPLGQAAQQAPPYRIHGRKGEHAVRGSLSLWRGRPFSRAGEGAPSGDCSQGDVNAFPLPGERVRVRATCTITNQSLRLNRSRAEAVQTSGAWPWKSRVTPAIHVILHGITLCRFLRRRLLTLASRVDILLQTQPRLARRGAVFLLRKPAVLERRLTMAKATMAVLEARQGFRVIDELAPDTVLALVLSRAASIFRSLPSPGRVWDGSRELPQQFRHGRAADPRRCRGPENVDAGAWKNRPFGCAACPGKRTIVSAAPVEVYLASPVARIGLHLQRG